MKLINEAQLDDQFTSQLDKLQQAIVKLEGIADAYSKSNVAPVRSQITALTVAGEDIVRLAKNLQAQYDKR